MALVNLPLSSVGVQMRWSLVVCVLSCTSVGVPLRCVYVLVGIAAIGGYHCAARERGGGEIERRRDRERGGERKKERQTKAETFRKHSKKSRITIYVLNLLLSLLQDR